MAKLTDFTLYADAQARADSEALWALFDGDRQHFNIARECILRHADGSGRTAVRIAHASGADESLSFDSIAAGWRGTAFSPAIASLSCWNLRCRSTRACSARC